MSLIDPDAIPGYREAIEQERADRDLAMMDRVPICGLQCRQISLRIWMLLNLCGNVFIAGGGTATKEEVAVILWMLSDAYCLNEKARQKWVKRNVRPLFQAGKFLWCVGEINQHLRRAFRDAPGGGKGSKQYVNAAAGVVDYLASEYGWSAREIMEMPIASLFLYQRAARMRHNPRAPMFNESDQILSRYMQDRVRGSEAPKVPEN
jgi:hypothetical protein